MRTRIAHGTTRRLQRDREATAHLDERWAEQVVLELRLRGASGSDIGAVLAEAESHCAESGTGAAESFGDPTEYARSLDLAALPDLSGRDLLRVVAPMAPQILGMLLVVWSVGGLRTGRPVEVTTGQLVVVATLAVEIAVAVRALDAVLTLAVRRPVLLWLGGMGAILVPVALMLLLDDVVLDVPASGAVVAGGALLAVGVLAAHRVRLVDAVLDPVVEPLSGSDAPPASGRAASAGMWLVPVGTVLLAGVSWWLAGV